MQQQTQHRIGLYFVVTLKVSCEGYKSIFNCLTIFYSDGEIENKTCGGNGVDCCTACNDTFTGDFPGDCLAVLFVPDTNQQQAAENLCKNVMSDGPGYCEKLPPGMNWYEYNVCLQVLFRSPNN